MQVLTHWVFCKQQTTASAADTMPVLINVRGDNLTVEVAGSATAFDLVLEGRVDIQSNDNWYTLACINLGNLSKVDTIDAAGLYQTSVEGISEIRANLRSVSGGSISVIGRLTAAM